jgi:hypothetical protein
MSDLLVLKVVIALSISAKYYSQTTSTNVLEENEIVLIKNRIIEQNDWAAIYPNPSYGSVTLISEMPAEVFIISETGTYIKNIKLIENETHILELPKGNYIIHFKSAERMLPKRIVVY